MLSRWQQQYTPEPASQTEILAIPLLLGIPFVIAGVGRLALSAMGALPGDYDVVSTLTILIGLPAWYFAIALTLTAVALSLLSKEISFSQAVPILIPIVAGALGLQILLAFLLMSWDRSSLTESLGAAVLTALLAGAAVVGFLSEPDWKAKLLQKGAVFGAIFLGYYLFMLAAGTNFSPHSFRFSLITWLLCAVLIATTFAGTLAGQLHLAMWQPKPQAISTAIGTTLLPVLFLYGLIYVSLEYLP